MRFTFSNPDCCILRDPLSAVSAGIGGVGSIVGGILGSSAASNAAKIQQENAQKVAGMATDASNKAQAGITDATQQANQGLTTAGTTAQQLYGTQTQNLSPYLAAGAQGATSLAQLMQPGGSLTQQFSFDPSQIASTPEYQFALQQGSQAVQQSAAANGLLNSGGTLKGLEQYGQGLASQTYQQAYNNALNTFQTNRSNTLSGLMDLTGIGQNATGQLNQATQNYSGTNTSIAQLMGGNLTQGATTSGNFGLQGAQIAGSALTGGANAAAAGTIGSANAWQNAIGGVANAATTGAQNAQLYNYMQNGGGQQITPTPAVGTPGFYWNMGTPPPTTTVSNGGFY